MKIDNEFTVSVPVDRAWDALIDLEGVSLCLPGARLAGVDGDVYRGEVRIKVGPVVSQYEGTAQFLEKDHPSYRAVIDAKGRDSRGAGNASARITVQLRTSGEHTVVSVDTDLKISGKIAQMGGGMIQEVSEKLLGQFAECLESKLAEPVPPQAPAVTAPSEIPVGETSVGDQRAQGATVSPDEATPAQEPVDLMALAGGAMAKRLVPALVVVVALVAVVVYLIVR
jgi:carbon monoxide dehydrogenase subunit G